MSQQVEVQVVGYEGGQYGPHSSTRWQIMYQEPGGSIVGDSQPIFVSSIGPQWPDVIDIDRAASARKRAVGILTDDGKILVFVTAIPHLGPCPGDNGGGGGGTGPGGTILPPGVVGPFVPLPPNEGGGGVMGGGGGPVSGGGGGI